MERDITMSDKYQDQNDANQENDRPSDQANTDDVSNEQSKIEALEAQLQQQKDQWIRAVADAENLRKRFERERQDLMKYAVSNFARDMLDVSDNLNRAMQSLPENAQDPALIAMENGLKMVESELLNIFKKHGIEKIDPKHKKFDPNFHQAMFEIESSDHEPGTVLEVMQVGYCLHDRLLKPAMVGVAKARKS